MLKVQSITIIFLKLIYTSRCRNCNSYYHSESCLLGKGYRRIKMDMAVRLKS